MLKVFFSSIYSLQIYNNYNKRKMKKPEPKSNNNNSMKRESNWRINEFVWSDNWQCIPQWMAAKL